MAPQPSVISDTRAYRVPASGFQATTIHER